MPDDPKSGHFFTTDDGEFACRVCGGAPGDAQHNPTIQTGSGVVVSLRGAQAVETASYATTPTRGLSLRFIQSYDAAADQHPTLLDVEAHRYAQRLAREGHGQDPAQDGAQATGAWREIAHAERSESHPVLIWTSGRHYEIAYFDSPSWFAAGGRALPWNTLYTELPERPR